MSEPLHVLVYGGLDSGVTDTLRAGMFAATLAGLGVDMRPWSSFEADALNGGPRLEALRWADVVLFRRWRPTHLVCTECETVFTSLADLESHVRGAGHRTMVPDLLLRSAVELVATYRAGEGRPAIVYDTDDDVLDYPAWTGFASAAARERDVVERILRLADLVTVATPVLAARLATYSRAEVRVVRNAVDPRWYLRPLPDAATRPAGDPRVVYHGVPVRLRDYQVALAAMDRAAAEFPALRRVWLGAAEEPRVAAVVDEVRPWVEGPAAFAAELVGARPDVGLAPLLDEPFNRAKSELHWLEYTMAGAAVVATGFDGPGPYDVVRDGTDGLIARTADDWLRHLRAVCGSPALREDLAGRARERVMAEYTVSTRAVDWAEAFGTAVQAVRRTAGSASSRRAGKAGPSIESVESPAAGLLPVESPAAGLLPVEVEDADLLLAGPLVDEEDETPTANLRVLVIGPGAASASDALRFEAFRPELAARGIELANWSGPHPDAAGADEFDELQAALGWANVVVLRRTYRTVHVCLRCTFQTHDRREIRTHARESGHEVVESPFALVRPLIGLLETEPDVLGDRAIVYDTDDDVFSADLPDGAEDWLERDLVARMLALADVVTVSTPVLAERMAPRTGADVRLLRNALDPAWFDGPPILRSLTVAGDIRVTYHGVAARLADYAVARPAVDRVKADLPELRRVWLGSSDPEVARVVDETRPWVPGAAAFAAALLAARPGVGLAPIVDTPYNRARSELHWLEYSLAGAPVIATGTAEPGPYDALRDGVDGLIARTPADWERHLRALAGSAGLRADIAGRARERVLADYAVAGRADEWADAYRSAAQRAGAGLGGRARGE